MPINKLALIRYKAIDECLRNRSRKWTLEDLIEKVAEVLYDYEGIMTISKRTIQADIQLMRSNKLGYNAPIVVSDRKYYSYSQKDYSITKSLVNPQSAEKMKEVIGILRQFQGFQYFDDMGEMISKMENYLYKNTQQSRNLIQFETNKQVKGMQFIYPLYQSILHEIPILLNYQSFKASKPTLEIYYPYLLKEYRNRWFLICRKKNNQYLMNLALDRIIEFQELPNESFVEYKGVDFETYFKETIGVTRNESERARKVTLRVDNETVPYLITKPIHPSQQVIMEENSTTLIRIDVTLNFELEREILGFGEQIEVVGPLNLRDKIKRRIQKSVKTYQ